MIVVDWSAIVKLNRLHTHTLFFAAISPPASPVFTTPFGSISISFTSRAANGLCSTPFGTTNISPGPRSHQRLGHPRLHALNSPSALAPHGQSPASAPAPSPAPASAPTAPAPP